MGGAWRLIVEESPRTGSWNMAVDRALQLARADGSVSPTVRIYSWIRPTVSLGRFQDAAGVDLDFCAGHGVDVVRRATGGRGVLHDDEVTYSLVASVDDGVPRGVAASYRHLCAGLAEAYRLLGVPAELTRRTRGDGASAACYLHATPADLSVGARKLSGSAQVWEGTTVLQHGSFTITRDLAAESAIFRLDDQARHSMADTTSTLADQLGNAPERQTVSAAIVEGFERGLGITLVQGELTAEETECARNLETAVLERGIEGLERVRSTSGCSEG
ncbi:MAG: lipoate--protein ligase family protein [Anaerosomatales bacterium]|nr:lipoate--protein ligase family protein [Anaerosomatales bacterium]MDT8433315.1 lipoate--protein ligase family protein [Anaerosomatales bacterium]